MLRRPALSGALARPTLTAPLDIGFAVVTAVVTLLGSLAEPSKEPGPGYRNTRRLGRLANASAWRRFGCAFLEMLVLRPKKVRYALSHRRG